MDSLCNQDNEINGNTNDFIDYSSSRDFGHHSLSMIGSGFNQQGRRLLSFSRKNSICSNSSVHSGLNTINKKKDVIIKNNGKTETKNKNINENPKKKDSNENEVSQSSQLKFEDVNEENDEDDNFFFNGNRFRNRANSSKIISEVRALYQNNFTCLSNLLSVGTELESYRKICHEPERILDAPNLNDNFFYNPLDWGSKNVLSVCLGTYVYLWNYNNLETSLLTNNQNEVDYCTTNFMDNGTCLALGLNNGETELWDIEKKIKIRTLKSHTDRVGALAWNRYNLYTGSKDTNIICHDVRIREHAILTLAQGHNKEICNIKWDPDFKYLASSGYDNLVCLWDIRSRLSQNSSFWNFLQSPSDDEIEELKSGEDSDSNSDNDIEKEEENKNLQNNVDISDNERKEEKPKTLCSLLEDDFAIKSRLNIKKFRRRNNPKKKEDKNIVKPFIIINRHKAPVKALAWSPWQSGVLATGGSKKDNFIRFFNVDTNSVISEYNTGSQVCQMLWNKYEKELITSHGSIKNQISLWSYPKMNKISDLTGHLSRVLYMSMSPDGCTLVSGSSDETLRFWNINEREKIKEKNKNKYNNNILSCFNSTMCLH